MMTDTYTSVSFAERKGKTFLRRVLREGCGYSAWMVRLNADPDGNTEVLFEKTVKGQPGDPDVVVNVRLVDAPVNVSNSCVLGHEAGSFTHLLLDGWSVGQARKAGGSQRSHELGILTRNLTASKGYYSVSIDCTVFYHGEVVVSGVCRDIGEIEEA